MRVCSYARRSEDSDKSDSIDNQFRMNREYMELNFRGQIDCFAEYYDADYSGGNYNQPELQRMLSDIKLGLYDVLIVYRIDRLARDVRDFSNIYYTLDQHNVKFISRSESIDTTTPAGKAMMYMSAVFSQMERETISSRSADNMLELVKKGYWVGGNPPIGFVRQHFIIDGRKHCTIVPDPEKIDYVNWIFDTFLENRYSLQSMETAFKNQGIKAPRGGFFSTTQLHQILTSPFYVAATPEIYDYFAAKGCKMYSGSPIEKWDGSCGVSVYGRTTERKGRHQKQPPSEWLVCLGLHEPIVPASKWLLVQERFSGNKFDKTMKYDIPLLKGVLRCSCGSIMCAARRKKKVGVSTWYYCLKNMRQGKEVCDRSQIKEEFLNEKVLDVFRSIHADPSSIYRFVKKEENVVPLSDQRSLSKKISSCEDKIGRLTASLAISQNSAAQKYIVAEIERLDLELQDLKKEQRICVVSNRARAAAEKTLEQKQHEISSFIDDFDRFTAAEKNQIVKDVIKECVWDGATLFISL